MSEKIEVKLQDSKSSLAGYISWERLETHLKATGEIKQNERITELMADKDGITYYVKNQD